MSQEPAPDHGPASILILDDAEDLRALVREVLEGAGHHVFEAGDLAGARNVVAGHPIDLVLCDIILDGGESGIELLRELAPRAPDVAVVMISGVTNIQTAIECLRDGAFDYVVKPSDTIVSDLTRAVGRVLERRRGMIAERDRAESRVRVLGKFSSENPNPILRVDREGLVLYANDAAQGLLRELTCEVGLGLPLFLAQFVSNVRHRGQRAETEVKTTDRIYSFTVTPIKDADYVFLYGHDITRLKETERELIRLKDQAQEMALHDALTGLPNRTLLEDRLQQALVRCIRDRKKLAVVFIDLDNFKPINDAHGHRVGDQILSAVAAQMQTAVRKTDTVARWGGDEMIVLLPGVRDAQEALSICDRIKRSVQKEFAEDPVASAVTLSMGLSQHPDDASDPELLLQQADTALYLAKSRGGNQVVVFGQSDELKSFQPKADLRVLLGEAIEQKRIQVHYQPIIDAATSQPVGVEALARWHVEQLGWVAPATFLPLAGSLGLTGELGRQVIERAMTDVSRWRADGLPLGLSVNISTRQLYEYHFLEDLEVFAARFGLPTEWITLEMTEGQSLLGLAAEGQRLAELAQRGFRLSIDDFGQGYSSFSGLYAMPVRELKIDKEFVRALQTDKGRRIVLTIVDMARTLGLETVAEGVETREEAVILRAMGVNRLQGYYYSKPLPADELFERLQSTPSWD